MEKRKHQVISTPHHHHPTPTTHLYEKKHVVRNRPYLIGTVHFEKATINTKPERLRQTCKTQTNFIGDCNPVMFDLHIIKVQTEREGERERERASYVADEFVGS